MKAPAGLKFWHVDSVIECLSFGENRQEVYAALHAAAPKAYEQEVPMGKVWNKLSEPIQQAVAEAYEREVAPLRRTL